MIQRLMTRSLALALALALVGCSTAPSATVTSLAVTGPTLVAGATAQFTATVTMSDGTTSNVTTASAWQSSNPAVATVSAAGVVTALTDGQVTITATYQSLDATDATQIIG
jgi:uncharacterized protein YjdB